MNTSRLGSQGPEITRVGLGASSIGGQGWGPVDDEESIAAIRHAIEGGINWVDTAASYGQGHSEEIVARAIDPYTAGEDVLVFSKCGLRWSDDDPGTENNLTPESIRFECEKSLERLGVERIDLFQFHWPDELGTPVEDSWGTMVELIEEGKVRWGGVSNFDVKLLDRCEAIRHVDSVQPPLSLIDRDALREVIPWAHEHGTGVIAYSPMASGLLTGRFTKDRAESLTEDDWRRDSLGLPGASSLRDAGRRRAAEDRSRMDERDRSVACRRMDVEAARRHGSDRGGAEAGAGRRVAPGRRPRARRRHSAGHRGGLLLEPRASSIPTCARER